MQKNHKKILPPPTPPAVLASDKLWQLDGKPSLPTLRTHLYSEGRISINDLKRILILASGLFEEEPNIIHIRSPLNVLGDIHGQFYDLLNTLMKITDSPSESPFLFLGDYVDRGYFGIETIIYLFSLKIHYPDSVFLLRGNHETRAMTSTFNFKAEVQKKYKSDYLYSLIMKVFDKLPIAAVVDDSWFCCHGGLSPGLKKLTDLEKLDRFSEPKESGIICDILWADHYREKDTGKPDKTKEESCISKRLSRTESKPSEWKNNYLRGCSYMYNEGALDKFLNENKLKGIVRAHEACENGFSVDFYRDQNKKIPKHITIFSAPNFCDIFKNLGAYLRIDHKGCLCKHVQKNKHCDLGAVYHNIGFTFVTFKEVEHPYFLPNFQNAFDLSFPFIAEKLTNATFELSKKFEVMKAMEESRRLVFRRTIKERNTLRTNGLWQRKDKMENNLIEELDQQKIEELGFEGIKQLYYENEVIDEDTFKMAAEMSVPSSLGSVSGSIEESIE